MRHEMRAVLLLHIRRSILTMKQILRTRFNHFRFFDSLSIFVPTFHFRSRLIGLTFHFLIFVGRVDPWTYFFGKRWISDNYGNVICYSFIFHSNKFENHRNANNTCDVPCAYCLDAGAKKIYQYNMIIACYFYQKFKVHFNSDPV